MEIGMTVRATSTSESPRWWCPCCDARPEPSDDTKRPVDSGIASTAQNLYIERNCFFVRLSSQICKLLLYNTHLCKRWTTWIDPERRTNSQCSARRATPRRRRLRGNDGNATSPLSSSRWPSVCSPLLSGCSSTTPAETWNSTPEFYNEYKWIFRIFLLICLKIYKYFFSYLIFVKRLITDNAKPITDKTNLNFSYSSLYLNLQQKKEHYTSESHCNAILLLYNSHTIQLYWLVAFIQYRDIDAS